MTGTVKKSPNERALSSGITWDGEIDITRSAMTLMRNPSQRSSVRSCDVIVDGGATATVIGWSTYIETSYLLGTKPIVLPREEGDAKYHEFGTQENISSLQHVIGR